MERKIVTKKDGQPFKLLFVGSQTELNYSGLFLNHYLQDPDNSQQDRRKGNLRFPAPLDEEEKNEAYFVEIQVWDDDFFETHDGSELLFDGILFYHKQDITAPNIYQFYEEWKLWGQGQIKKIAFIGAYACPEEFSLLEEGEAKQFRIFGCGFNRFMEDIREASMVENK